MRSNYKKIGTFVRQVSTKNTDLAVTDLKGISINKEFMPSVANVNGTDLSKYRVVKKEQFAFNPMHVGRDEVIPISMLETDEKVIVSPAYVVFEIIDKNELDPEYLMMWCRRPEFDRNAWFTTDSSVRGGFSWADFCEMKLPVPSIEKQREIVKEYNTVVNRIKLNEQLNQKLEETAQAVYKQWFVDFEFPINEEYANSINRPDLTHKPYKSSGGEMVYNKELGHEIPARWRCEPLGNLVLDTIGGDWGKDYPQNNYQSEVLCIRGTDIPNIRKGQVSFLPKRYILKNNLHNKKLLKNIIVVEISGGSPIQSTGRSAIILNSHFENSTTCIICSNFCRAITLRNSSYAFFMYSHLQYLYNKDVMFIYENSTTGVKNFDLNGFFTLEKIIIPEPSILNSYNKLYETVIKSILNCGKENIYLGELKNTILSHMVSKQLEVVK